MLVRKYTEVELDVEMSDFSDKEIVAELRARGVPEEILTPLIRHINNRTVTHKDLEKWLEASGVLQ